MWSPDPERPRGWGDLLEHPHALPLPCPLQPPAFAPSGWDTVRCSPTRLGTPCAPGPRVPRAGHPPLPTFAFGQNWLCVYLFCQNGVHPNGLELGH